jgi:DNA repair protein MmcB-like
MSSHDSWGHDSLAADLARKLMHDGKVWCWLNSTIGAWSGPRPDVMAYRRYSYDQPQIHAYEIKVSRSDLFADLNAEKWRKYLEHCQSVTFAMPSGMATKDEIPSQCGVMFRTGRGWRTERRPTNIGSGCSVQAMAKLLTMHPLRLPPIGNDGRIGGYQMDAIQRVAAERFQAEAGQRFGHALARLARDVAEGKDPAGKAREKAAEIIEEAKTDAQAIIGWLKPLCEDLGVPFNENSLWTLRTELTSRMRAIDIDHRTRMAAEALEAGRRAIEKAQLAMKPVPDRDAA